jgi:hypothetical protein
MDIEQKSVRIGDTLVKITITEHPESYELTYEPALNYLETDSKNGEVIAKTPLHLHLINTLLKSDNDLKKECGLTQPSDYRVQLTRSISCLWD